MKETGAQPMDQKPYKITSLGTIRTFLKVGT